MNHGVESARARSGGVSVPSRTAGRPVTAYDFRRPIQLSREHARVLQVSFDAFARQATTVFTAALRRVCQVTLRSVEQRSYAEYVESLPQETYLTIFSMEPVPGNGVLEIPLPAVMTCLDHMLGGPGGPDQPQRPLTDIEGSVAGGLVARLVGELRYALEELVVVDPQVVGIDYSPQLAQVAAAAEVVVAVRMDLEIESFATSLSLCLPFHGLVPHLVAAAAPALPSERERAQRAESARLLRGLFDEVPVEVAVRFRTTHASPYALGTLAVGDVVRLAHPAEAPLEVHADQTTFALATAGSKKDKLAALIVGTPEEAR